MNLRIKEIFNNIYTHSILERKGFSKLNYRLWFSRNSKYRSTSIEIGYNLKRFAPHISVRLYSFGDADMCFSFNFLIHFYLCTNLPKKWIQKFKDSLPQYEYDREIDLAIHHNTLWWNFWTSGDSWSSSTPRYRKGSFNFLNFLLGKYEVDIISLEEAQYKIYTDSGINNIILQKELFIKYRNRWYIKWFKNKFFRWEYNYGTIENCTKDDKECYCRPKGTLNFEYQTPKEGYEKIVQNPLTGATKFKWNSDETYSGSFYDKHLKELDEAYLHLVKMIYSDKLKHSHDKYKIYNNET